MVTVEVCGVGPVPPGPDDPRALGGDLTGEGLEVVGGWVDALTEAIVGEALSASSPSSSPITHLPSSPSGGGGGGGGGGGEEALWVCGWEVVLGVAGGEQREWVHGRGGVHEPGGGGWEGGRGWAGLGVLLDQ